MILFRVEAIFASSISKFGKFFLQTDRDDFNSSNESTTSTSLLHDTASDGKSEQPVTWFLNRIFHTKNDCGVGNLSNCSSEICCLCGPIIEFCGNFTGTNELIVDGLPANVGIGIVPLFCLSSLVQKRICPCSLWNWPSFSLWCARVNSLKMISGWNKRRKLITKKRFPVIQMYSMCQEACVCRGSAWNEHLESLQADWKRMTISHYSLNCTSWNSHRITHRIHLTLHFLQLSFCIVSLFYWNFCTETSSTLVIEIALFEIQKISVVRLAIPIFEHKHVAVAHC